MHFEHVGGDHLRLGLDLAAGHRGRGAGDRRRARAVGAEPVGRGVGVAVLDLDVVGRQPELGRDDLGVGRLVALPLRLGAEPANPAAGRMDADLGAVEHGDAEDVAGARRAGADDLGEERDADAHQLARLAAPEGVLLRLLLRAQFLVVDRLHRLVHGGVIVAGIVFPAHRRGVGELLAPDQVLHAELGRVQPELLRHDVHGALDAVGGLRDAERAAIGDAAGRLVGVDAVDQDVRGREIVGAGDDAEQAGRPLGGVGAGVERAVVGDGVAAQRRHLAVLGRGDLRLHVEVARERRGREVLDAVLDPFHRASGHDRGDDRADVARIGADLVAEAAADVGGDDMDLVLGNLGDERADRADDVGRLERAP